MTKLANSNHDIWDLYCGHDLVCILSVGLRKVLGSQKQRNVESDLLGQALRLAYETAYFLTTNLYQALRLWEENNRPFQIFPTLQKEEPSATL